MSRPFDIDALAWEKQAGLLPAVVQDADSLRVLMLGYMNREALELTLAHGRVTFFSRSRNRLWTKGETSGNVLALAGIETDCDADTLLVRVRAQGPTCHLGSTSCFAAAPGSVLHALEARIVERDAQRLEGGAAGSYTARLMDSGIRRIAQKVGEEGVETALAAVAQDEAALCGEAADLLYHLLVLLRARGLALDDVLGVLRAREGGAAHW